ncbi:Gfo/Idh/MocA family oxidoreductase [Bdellovibrionota bacterium FG-1]
MTSLRVGIVGAGLIGGKRAASMPGAKLVAVADIAMDRAKTLADAYGATAYDSWQELMARKDIDAVIIATTNAVIPVCAKAALESGKHALVEKPAGRHTEDLQGLVEATHRSDRILRVGFNHRFHPGFQKAKEIMQSGGIGPLMYIRARYGHGGRIGYDKEWRAVREISGGGELLDQGVHLIDLCRWLGGEFELEYGRVETFFWDMPVEDNGFLLLKAPGKKQYCHIHASCTEWKNLFDFEIFGQTGKLQIWGLGRSYGTEELRYYKMKPEMGPPDTEVFTFPGEDRSWLLEWDAFLAEIEGKHTDLAKAEDALRAVTIVGDAYKQTDARKS